MAYDPNDPLDFYPGLASTSGYRDLVLMHPELYEAFTPPIADVYVDSSTSPSTSATVIGRLRIRGNLDLRVVRLRVRASVAGGGTATLVWSVGGVSTSQAITGAAAWYTVDVTPTAGGSVAAFITVATDGSATLTLERYQVRIVSAAASGRLASGFVPTAAYMLDLQEPIASEHIQRLLDGPALTARERPACVLHHVVMPNTSSKRDLDEWQAYNVTYNDLVGVARLPQCDTRKRVYILDAYTIESGTGATCTITVGAADWQITSMGGTSGAWHTTRLELSPGPHDVRVVVSPGAGASAMVATLQVWRSEAVY